MTRLRKTQSEPILTAAREICYACWRPAGHCLCSIIKPCQAHCNIMVLQHPAERRKYYSTAKLLLKAVTNSRLERGIIFDTEQLLKSLKDQNTYLLYPGTDALDCEAVELDSKSTVMVVDGTWREARKILFRNPELKKLPKLSFKTELRSQYKIRKQPKDHCLSTIESVGHLLRLNALAFGKEKESKSYDGLFEIFLRMVDKQFSYFPRNAPKGNNP